MSKDVNTADYIICTQPFHNDAFNENIYSLTKNQIISINSRWEVKERFPDGSVRAWSEIKNGKGLSSKFTKKQLESYFEACGRFPSLRI